MLVHLHNSTMPSSPLDFETAVKQEEAYLRKVHPTPEDIPGCVKLLDSFLLCNGTSYSLRLEIVMLIKSAVVASQARSLYRYGQMAECGQKFEDFKYCMSNKAMHPQEKYEAWIRRRAEWWAHRRMSKSSEDVWEIRT